MRIFVFSLVLLSACSSQPGEPPQTPEPGPADAYCAAYARNACARLAACGLISEEVTGACRVREVSACEWELGRFVRGGAVALSAEAAQLCADRLEAIGCLFIESAEARSVCFHDGAIRSPNAQLGERCHATADCVQGHCATTSPLACGVCTPYPAQGDACGACDPATSYCERDAGGGSGTCQQFLADGETCQRDAQCGSGVCNSAGTCGTLPRGSACSRPAECSDADYCSAWCNARVAEGASCQFLSYSDPWSGCMKELRCVNGTCVTAAHGVVPDEGKCLSHEECVSGICFRYSTSVVGTCAPPPDPGASCSGSPGVCAEGETCAYRRVIQNDRPAFQLFCAPPAAAGEACIPYSKPGSGCMVGLRCVPQGSGVNACGRLGEPGDACAADGDCLSRRCESGACVVPGGVGAACSDDRACVDRCVLRQGETSGICSAACFPPAG